MDALDAILTRRSIRRYRDSALPEGAARKLLECGFAAPSAKDRRPLHFVLVGDRGKLDALGAMHPYAAMVADAAAAIAVCGDLSLEERSQMLNQDGAAAAQNMLLAAHAMGLGAVWCGVPEGGEREEAIRGICGLPAGIVPLALLAFGLPDEEKGAPSRYDDAKVHRDRW